MSSESPMSQSVAGTSRDSKFSRLNEKEELDKLNDRLACYIVSIRSLESENSRLTRELKTSRENVSREVDSVKSMYENELEDARKLLDDLSFEKAEIQLDTRRLYSENEQLKADLDKKINDNNVLQTTLNVTEGKLSDSTAKVSVLKADQRKLLDDFKTLQHERNRFNTELGSTRILLEEETLKRVELENALQSVRENLAFKEELYEQQLTEARKNRQKDISEIDGRMSQEHEERPYRGLQEIKVQYEANLTINKDEIKKMYEEKPVTSPDGKGTPRKFLKGKRKPIFSEGSDEIQVYRFSITSSPNCDITISEVDPKGNYIKLTNKSPKEAKLGGWQVIQTAGESSTIYSFKQSVKLEPGASVTIWSANVCDTPHNTPENLVMKSKWWFVAENIFTTLLNKSGEEMATAEYKRQKVIKRKSIPRQEDQRIY